MNETSLTTHCEVVVVGAGMAGLYSAYLMNKAGYDVRVVEAGSGVGGTWFWNRYPGARCDVNSVDYSFSFSEELQDEWDWTERYASQPEIEAYLNHVTERFELRSLIDFNTRIISATFVEADDEWVLSAGERSYRARFCIMATGPLSASYGPTFDGMDEFEGRILHTADWPREGVDLTGKRVGVVGTGSTGIQLVPVLAEQCNHLTVFQRTPNYSVPARNHPLTSRDLAAVRANYPERRAQARSSRSGFPPRTPPISAKGALEVTSEQRHEVYELMWEQGGGLAFRAAFSDLLTNRESNETAAEFIRAKIRDKVIDPQIAETLTPRDHPYAAKRPPVDTNYYETFNRDNVTLVDLRKNPIARLTATGVDTTAVHHDLDILILATGFDAVTGALARMEVRGLGGETLTDVWLTGPRTYLGMTIHGFPNLFLVNGPGSTAAFTNMATHTEQNVEWIAAAIEHLRSIGARRFQPTLSSQDAWVEHVRQVGDATLYPEANSWYLGANIPGKPRSFMFFAGGFDTYSQECARAADEGYREFEISTREVQSGSSNKGEMS